MWAVVICFLYYVIFGFAFSRFISASFTNAVFDRFINSKIEGAQVDRGLHKEDDDDDDRRTRTNWTTNRISRRGDAIVYRLRIRL